MTRIVLDPPSMSRQAAVLRHGAEREARAGSRLAESDLAGLPPELRARFAGEIRGLSAGLASVARDLEAQAERLERRAAAAERDVGRRLGAVPAGGPGAALAPGEAAPAPESPAGGGDAPPSAVAPEAAATVTERLGAPGDAEGGAPLQEDAAPSDVRAHEAADGFPGEDAPREDLACWIASSADAAGTSPLKLLATAISRSGLQNIAGPDGVGLFGISTGDATAPPGFGEPPGAQMDAQWWIDHPEAQLAAVSASLGDGGVPVAERAEAARLIRDCEAAAEAAPAESAAAASAPSGGLAGGVLAAAGREIGVQEAGGANQGQQVGVYQATTGAYGAPWCASFVTWALGEAGHEMPAGNWAAVANYVSAARSGLDGMQLVDPADARPGDLVAYDWGGGSDFGADGHIGLLASDVGGDGGFQTIEGNYQDAVGRVDRSLGQANIVFIRMPS